MIRALSPLVAALFAALLLVGCGSDGPSVSSASSCDELAEAAEGPLKDQLKDAVNLLNDYDVDSRAELDTDAQEELDEEFDAIGEDFNDELDDKAEELDCEDSFLDAAGCSIAEDIEGDADSGVAKEFVANVVQFSC